MLSDLRGVGPGPGYRLTALLSSLIEKDHLGDCSPKKDCCLRLTFRQPVRKPSSKSSDLTSNRS